jgi:hypothetical protein
VADQGLVSNPYNPIYQHPFGYVLTSQEYEMHGVPGSVPKALQSSTAWPRFADVLTLVRDTWTFRRNIEPGSEEDA